MVNSISIKDFKVGEYYQISAYYQTYSVRVSLHLVMTMICKNLNCILRSFMIYIPGQIKKDEIGRECGMNGDFGRKP
jgi:hypothetical protein